MFRIRAWVRPLFAASVLLGACDGSPSSTPPPPQPTCDTITVTGQGAGQCPATDPTKVSPVDLPAQVKQTDFRFNPPQVLDITLTSSAQGPLLAVQFADDPRLGAQITVHPEEEDIVLRDDGTGGDMKAGDHIFSAIVKADIQALVAEQQREVSALRLQMQPFTFPVFKGREKLKDVSFAIEGNSFHPILGGLPALVDRGRSLTITATSVVEDPTRASLHCGTSGAPMGKWSFGYLMTQMANPTSGIDPSEFVERWLQTWETDQPVNFFPASARPGIMAQVLSGWPRLPGGKLDLSRAPMKLLAIVNRIDLASNSLYGAGSGGEARFVFGVMDPSGCTPMPFTVILEYGVPRHSCLSLRDWASQWLHLGTLALGSPAYNAGLEAITEQFARANADPSKFNGSAINQVRTDEIALAAPWELREFRLFPVGATPPHLHLDTVKQTPDQSFNGAAGGARSGDLAQWINLHAAAVVNDQHSVGDTLAPSPPFRAGDPFLGASAPNPTAASQRFWNADGIVDPNARFHFSLDTCSGCHGRETNTTFLHVAPAAFGSEAALSGFLTGETVTDPVSSLGTTHTFADLDRRAAVLEQFANRSCFFHFPFRPILASH